MNARRALLLAPFVVACGTTVVVGEGFPGGGSGGAAGTGGTPAGRTTSASSGSGTGTTASSSSSAGAGTGGATASSSGAGGATGGATASSGSVGSSSGAGGQDAGTVTVGPGFHLVGVYWDGAAVRADLVDPQTGQGAPLGQLGDLGGWSPNLVLSADGTRLYGIGNPPGSSAYELVTLDMTAGTWTAVKTAQTQEYVLAGATDDGHVIGVFWNGSFEQVDLVDPTTGVGTSAGQLGDLHTWPDQLVYDHAGHVVYAWGKNISQYELLYSLNVDTQVSHAVPVSFAWSFPLGGVTPSGTLVGMTWDGSLEHVETVDPATGAATPAGLLAGTMWIPQFGGIAYDASTGTAYALGQPPGMGPASLYTVDLATSQASSVHPARNYALARP